MPVSLTHLRSQLMPGLHLMSNSGVALALADVPARFVHLRAVFGILGIKRVGDLRAPRWIKAGDAIYETRSVLEGREYPQGWGRGPGGAAAEPPPEPDGKVDVFRDEDNANMAALKNEINDFIHLRGWDAS